MRAFSHHSPARVDVGGGKDTQAVSLNGYRVLLVSSVSELEGYADPWDRLVAAAPNRVHTISHAWIASFLKHLVASDEGYACLLAFEGDALTGVMPLLISKKYFSLLTKSEVCPPTSPQTFASDIVCRANDADDIVDVMVRALDRFLPTAWELEFHHVSERSPAVGHFSNGTSSLLSSVELDGYGNVVRTTGSYDDYLGSLHPKFARNLRRAERKIRLLPGFNIQHDPPPLLQRDCVAKTASAVPRRVLPEEVQGRAEKNPICQTHPPAVHDGLFVTAVRRIDHYLAKWPSYQQHMECHDIDPFDRQVGRRPERLAGLAGLVTRQHLAGAPTFVIVGSRCGFCGTVSNDGWQSGRPAGRPLPAPSGGQPPKIIDFTWEFTVTLYD